MIAPPPRWICRWK